MKRAIYYRLIALSCAVLLVANVIVAVNYAVYTQNQTKEWLTKLTLAAAEAYVHNPDAKSLSRAVGNSRVTIIAPDGTVLDDSDVDAATMENHAEREEVRYAQSYTQNDGVYLTMRASSTLGERFMYAATVVDDGTIIRLAHSYAGLLYNLVIQLPAIAVAMLVALVLSLFLARRFSETVADPLEQQKRDFFSNASHELKTPVTSILGFSEMLNKNMVKGEQEKADIMRRIETEAKRMSALISDILTVSKLESNAGVPEYAEFDLADVVRDAVDSVSPIADDTTIAINTDLDDIIYRANRRQMYELCVNLIENAVKYNVPDGQVDISLKRENGDVILTVKDTGIGIPPEYQARVFERFFRADYGRDKKVGGTGLGLSIVKHIVSIYGGKITLQSKQGEGTVVIASLPVLPSSYD